jgi:hypothetical protein
MQTEDEDADVEAALDTSDEMAVGTALRRRKVFKDKRSISRSRTGGVNCMLGLGQGQGEFQGLLRSSSIDDAGMEGGGLGAADAGRSGGRGGGGGGSSSGSRSHKRRARRHSSPGFTLSEGDSDGHKRERLRCRLEFMRRLPRGSRFASQQIDIITKALGILDKTEGGLGAGDGGRVGAARTSNENDELSRLLASVSL